MRQPDDNLHQWIRQSLAAYRPDAAPDDWRRVQRRLRRRRWARRAAVVGGGLFLLSALTWLIKSTGDSQLTDHNQPVWPPKAPAPANPPHRVVTPALIIRAKKSMLRASSPVAVRPPLISSRPATVLPALLQPLVIVTPLPARLSTLTERASSVRISGQEAALVRQVQTGEFGSDSTSYRVVARNLAQWPNAVLVCDLTTSMYPYTTQLVTWLKNRVAQPNLLGMVFFTDCDSLGRQTQPGGPPGQMFLTRGHDASALLPTLVSATRNTIQNKDDAENDVEALLFAQRAFPNASHLILVADNMSRVKDMALLPKLTKPVHVVLCGTTGGDTTLAFQPEFGQIARRTGGSLHTLEDDLNPLAIAPTQTLRVGPYYYRYQTRQKQFKLTPFQHRPRRFLGFLWF